MTKLRYAHCNDLFTPAPQVPKQTYCSKPKCQKERRKQWQKNRLQSDPDYRANQSRAQKAWSEKPSLKGVENRVRIGLDLTDVAKSTITSDDVNTPDFTSPVVDILEEMSMHCA